MNDVTFLPGAEVDYSDGLDWYQKRSARAAAGFERVIEEALGLICSSPTSWAKIDELHHLFVVQAYPYSIIYRIEANTILVVALVHGSRDEGYWRHRAP